MPVYVAMQQPEGLLVGYLDTSEMRKHKKRKEYTFQHQFNKNKHILHYIVDQAAQASEMTDMRCGICRS